MHLLLTHRYVRLQEAIEAEVRKGNSPESMRLARNISHMSMGSDPSMTPPQGDSSNNLANLGATIDSPYMSKLESVASSAVKAADKVAASLIIVFTNTGKWQATCTMTAMHFTLPSNVASE